MQDETRAEVDDLIDTIESLGWSVWGYSVDEESRAMREISGRSEERLEQVGVDIEATKDYPSVK